MNQSKEQEGENRLERIMGGFKEISMNFFFPNFNHEYEERHRDSPLVIDHQRYTIRRDQKKGEKELVNLARTERDEGIWNFSPLDSRWYHVSLETKEIDNQQLFLTHHNSICQIFLFVYLEHQIPEHPLIPIVFLNPVKSL